MAAQLMSNGARQQEIVKVLYGAQKAPEKSEPKTVAQAIPSDTLQQLQAAAEQMKQSGGSLEVGQDQVMQPAQIAQ